MNSLPHAVVLERTLTKNLEELVGFQGCPSPGNPMTSTFPPLFTFTGEVADDPKLVAALKVIFSEHLDSKGEMECLPSSPRMRVPRFQSNTEFGSGCVFFGAQRETFDTHRALQRKWQPSAMRNTRRNVRKNARPQGTCNHIYIYMHIQIDIDIDDRYRCMKNIYTHT